MTTHDRLQALIDQWRLHPSPEVGSCANQLAGWLMKQVAPVVSEPQQLAERIARQAHKGQTEESTGDDYIHHIERVVAMVDGDDAKAVAWLHDTLEDAPLTAFGLQMAGIPEHIVEAVERLTRSEEYDISYSDYIDKIEKSGSQLAIDVKLADLRDHLRPNCPERLRPRYERALAKLSASRGGGDTRNGDL